MPSSRREFLGAAAASSALIALYGPGALANAAVASDEARVAGRVLDAVTLAPFNDLAPRDWAAFAEQRLNGDAAGERPAFVALGKTRSEFAGLTPQDATDRLIRMLIPDYRGPRYLSREEWMAEFDATLKAIADGPDVDAPSETGRFRADPASAAERGKYLVITPATELRTSRVASDALQAANALLGRPELESKDGLGLPV